MSVSFSFFDKAGKKIARNAGYAQEYWKDGNLADAILMLNEIAADAELIVRRAKEAASELSAVGS